MVIFKERSNLNRLMTYSMLVFLIPIILILSQEDKVEIWTIVVTGGLFLTVFLLLYNTRLELNMYADRLEFRFLPFKRRWQTIPYTQIENMQIITVDPVSELGGWGARKSKKYGKAYVTKSDTGLWLFTHDGGKYFFSISDSKKLRTFLANLDGIKTLGIVFDNK